MVRNSPADTKVGAGGCSRVQSTGSSAVPGEEHMEEAMVEQGNM